MKAQQQKKYADLRVRQQDIETLKIVAALRREPMIQTFKSLVSQELHRLQQQLGPTTGYDEPHIEISIER